MGSHPNQNRTTTSFYATASNAEQESVLVPALISAVVSAIVFLAVAGALDVIRFFPSEEPVEAVYEPVEAVYEPSDTAAPESSPSGGWTREKKQRKAELELRIAELLDELEEARAQAEQAAEE